MESNNRRQKLLREIQMTKFAVIEARMFLDTHPDHQEALKFYRKYADRLCELKTEWEKNYGPVTEYENGELRWSYTDNPWPWHYEEV